MIQLIERQTNTSTPLKQINTLVSHIEKVQAGVTGKSGYHGDTRFEKLTKFFKQYTLARDMYILLP